MSRAVQILTPNSEGLKEEEEEPANTEKLLPSARQRFVYLLQKVFIYPPQEEKGHITVAPKCR